VPVGFALGAWTGARFLIPANAGLAGGAMVFWYGLAGAGIALLLSGVAIRWRGARRVKIPALVLAVLAAGVLGSGWLTFQQQQRERDAARQQSMARLPPFELVLAGKIAVTPRETLTVFAYRSADNDWRVTRADGQTCLGGLPAGKAGDRSRVELLGALRGLDVAGVLVDPPACQHAGQALATLDVAIHEAKPPITEGRLRLTSACRREIPEIEVVFDKIQAVYRRHREALVCQ